MNKLLLESDMDYYSQYDTIKMEETNSALYPDTSFYAGQSSFTLTNNPESYTTNKVSNSSSPSATVCPMDPPVFTSSSSNGTSRLLDDMIKSKDTAAFYSNFYSPMTKAPPPQFQQQQQQQQDAQPQRKKQRRQGSIQQSVTSSPVLTTTPTISEDRSFMGFNMTTPHLSSETEYDLDSTISPAASPDNGNSTTEIRRQIHIQSEQKRRAQIKCGFEELRNELPTCLNKKMSKVALLHRTVQHLRHLKSTQISILAELERLVQENDQLKRFQQSVLQNQVMYTIQ
ncbi:hypothetical protein BC941DRAFT_409815 [Chlamydoabsidia padenii]|nr:hypothetical protein BC941DRAFT_409815 [Chlamydoabsidia padenii]